MTTVKMRNRRMLANRLCRGEMQLLFLPHSFDFADEGFRLHLIWIISEDDVDAMSSKIDSSGATHAAAYTYNDCSLGI